jgi:hypothetical protein
MSKWYNIEILGKEVNWASVVASGVLFLGLELYRRKNLSRQVRIEVKKSVDELAMNQSAPNKENIVSDIIDRLT